LAQSDHLSILLILQRLWYWLSKMRLIKVQALLEVEGEIREGREVNPRTMLMEEHDSANTSYAILSHRWGDEVNYREIDKLPKMMTTDRDEIRARSGYEKILKSCEQADLDGFKWLWIDTCCIDKRSSSELSEAINSMYQWYSNSGRCYVYLHDFEGASLPTECDEQKYCKSGGWPEWFSRGWTLQELMAPKDVQFFNQTWSFIGDKQCDASAINKITRIPLHHLLAASLLKCRPSAAQIMAWAAGRETTQVEDRAYSLMGLLGVHMPLLYGEGNNAFRRLQLEFIRISDDQSIFAWGHTMCTGPSGSVLADDPSFFWDCHDVYYMEQDAFIQQMKYHIPLHDLPVVPSADLRSYSVTNAGIKIWLPIAPYANSQSVFEAILACDIRSSTPVTILLAFSGSTYHRYFGAQSGWPSAISEFQHLLLAHQNQSLQTEFIINFDFPAATSQGFSQHCVYPNDITLTAKSITLTREKDMAVIVYADANRARFAIAIGNFKGEYWVHLVCDTPPEGEVWPQLENYALGVYDRTRAAGPDFVEDYKAQIVVADHHYGKYVRANLMMDYTAKLEPPEVIHWLSVDGHQTQFLQTQITPGIEVSNNDGH
ncbi:hypothetical protein ID866_10825, partial [Astraeus odoratus]